MQPLQIGQTLYGKPVENRARWDKEIAEGVVEKIGRKYVTVRFGSNVKQYHRDTLDEKSEYVPEWKLYFSKQEILDEEELMRNRWSIETAIKKMTVEQSRQILEILQIKRDN
ncbi:hypothetical protein ACFYKX_11460 [Cytobacillus sp. FJAT-54145]|uniref:Uncharacterized protein n=1 Tax=Cytobacillus spartinae TaxID=3299023 RepID=A0ABW6KEI0_9BACI